MQPFHLYHFACALVATDQIEAGLEVLLDMLRRDKSWSEDKARQTMIRVFELLGKGDPMASTYRRKMFTLMHYWDPRCRVWESGWFKRLG